MGIYKQGLDRNQQLLFPPSLDELIDENNIARAIDSYVEILNIHKLNIKTKKSLITDGQPAFHPKLLLKIYIYGYLNKIRSSRKLEAEIKRNIELMWLTQGLTPSYKTIANFRKDNPKALQKIFKEFSILLKDIKLITGELVGIDGAFLRANASKNTLIMKKTVQNDLAKIDKDIKNYMELLDTLDKDDSQSNIKLSVDDIANLKDKKEQLHKDLALLDSLGKEQHNKTDKDANVMSKPAHNLMAYNSQIAVDDKFKFIIASDISLNGHDLDQLHNMSIKSKEIVDNKDMIVTADKGYYSSVEIKKCVDDEIETIVPPRCTATTKKIKDSKFSKNQFQYHKDKDCYICPNNQILENSTTQYKRDKRMLDVYRLSSTICKSCPLKPNCLSNKTNYKQMYRWENESIIDDYTTKMNTKKAKDIVKKRGSIVEHPFGTIKRTLGWDHFLVRSKEKVLGENALIMFTYNFRRLLNLIGITLFKKLCISIKNKDLTQVTKDIEEYILVVGLYLVYFLQIFLYLENLRKNTKYSEN
ncbi:IS1182 family transposase [Halarcobacter sp.]|uniref:IS1182 family transposase n=1 Tax=Halarcobacter sp. TaxID=2321133 RepID=UPI002AAB1641|nr:IS1182 family transposase [Halarcobacter sp.]